VLVTIGTLTVPLGGEVSTLTLLCVIFMPLQLCVQFISKCQLLQRRFCKEIPEMSCLVFLIPSSFVLRMYVMEIRVFFPFFFVVLIYLPRMTDLPALPNMRTAVSFISIYWHKPTPYKLFQTLCVSRGLQWSRRIQITLPENPLTANSAFLLRLDCSSKL
jgi:hypothetical protein